MLPKKIRLPRDKFSAIFKKGLSFRSKYFTLLYLAQEGQNSPQFGIIASLKVGKANKRIKCKRRIRGMILENIDKFPKDRDYVFICRKELVDASVNELRQEFNKIFSKSFKI